MAKEPKAAEAAIEKSKYNINMLAEELGKEPADIRAMLRRSTIEKPGTSWAWNRKSEFDAAIKELKGMKSRPRGEKSEAPTEAEAPKRAAKPRAQRQKDTAEA